MKKMNNEEYTEKKGSYCGLAAIGGLSHALCAKEKCALWVSVSQKCAFKDLAHSVKIIANGVSKHELY